MVTKNRREKDIDQIMKEYIELKVPGADGFEYNQSTAQAIAYERMIESKREDRLFNDPLAEHFIGDRGQRVSKFLNDMLVQYFNIENFCMMFTACRTRLINDHLEMWINKSAEKEQKM